MHIIGSKQFGGAENFYVRLINALQEFGHPVSAVNPPDSDVISRIYPAVQQFHPKMRNVYDLFSRWNINSLIKHNKPDIVQTYMGRATRLTHINPKNGPVHVARLGGYYDLKGYRHAHAWVGNTKGICEYLINNGCPEDRVFYAGNFVDMPDRHNSLDLERFRLSYEIPEQARLLVTVGRAHVNKAFDTLLYAFKQILRKNNDSEIYLIVVGDGPELDALKALSRELGIDMYVRFAGWQNETNIFYQSADLFICPSRHEPLGNVILEAWSQQCPVLSTRSQGATELIEQETNGYLVEVDDIQDMADGIVYLLENTELRDSLCKKGYKTVSTQFSREQIISDYLAIYSKLLDR